ncbi:hypothetical protein [Oribacterium sp. FC2011]|uniref:hypothetical protein n=1 Tax=Oribacterium sp. FC2011 TaxID=1408311 RepID=UPI0004E1926F|nr:hypothetical protein [Oribacterium sp. FC2011]
MFKKSLSILLTVSFILLMSMASFADGWRWESDDTEWVKKRIYFKDGVVVRSGITPDGLTVDDRGAWIFNGVKQIMTFDTARANSVVSTNQVITVNPDFKKSQYDSVIGVKVDGEWKYSSMPETHYGLELFSGFENREYSMNEIAQVLQNSGATNIVCEPEIKYGVKLGTGWSGGNMHAAFYGTTFQNKISFSLGGHDYSWKGLLQAKDDDDGDVWIYEQSLSGDEIWSTFNLLPDFYYFINPVSAQWDVR